MKKKKEVPKVPKVTKVLECCAHRLTRKARVMTSRRFPINLSALFFALLLFLLPSFLSGAIDFSGYFENRFFLLNHKDVKWENLKEKFELGDYNRLRLKLKASPSEKVTVNVAVDFFSFHGIINSPLGTNDNTAGSATELGDDISINLDRAYVELYFKHFDITIGKQRVAMGVSYLWAPLDIFNRVNVFEPKEEKPGANAFKAYVPLGNKTSLTAVFAPEDNFSTARSGLRAQTQMFGVDAALTLIRQGDLETSIYGLDLRGENFFGWWVEVAHFVAPEEKYDKIVLGFDYTFPIKDGLYWLNELFYDSGGQKDSSHYDYTATSSGLRFTLGRKYFFSMLRYGFSEFISASLSYIGNLEDGSCFVNPSLQYEVFENVSLATGLYIPMGKTGEFNNSRRSIFFLWLKVNF
ncbi:MAG: DUF3373 domain-containing protein [bacterium]|nr:DUF3373 domain-containing protein [bacterium]